MGCAKVTFIYMREVTLGYNGTLNHYVVSSGKEQNLSLWLSDCQFDLSLRQV